MTTNRMSPEARKKQSKRMKAYWAEYRKQKAAGKLPVKEKEVTNNVPPPKPERIGSYGDDARSSIQNFKDEVMPLVRAYLPHEASIGDLVHLEDQMVDLVNKLWVDSEPGK